MAQPKPLRNPTTQEMLSRAPRKQSDWDDWLMRADAAVRGAAETVTFGGANSIAAAGDALLGWGGSGDFSSRYRSNLEEQKRRDASDEEERPGFRTMGKIAGAAILYGGAFRPIVSRIDRLPPYRKGQVGEAMSQIKTLLAGDVPVASQVRIGLSKGYTRADQTTLFGKIVESKLGPWASLSPQQKRAVIELAKRYRVDWWLKEDVGAAVGGTAAGAGLATSDGSRR